MKQKVTLALDAMGGRYAPESVICGVLSSLDRYPHVHYLLFGDQDKLISYIQKYPALGAKVSIMDTKEVVSDEMKPAHALRVARNSSMALAVKAVKNGMAQGVISGGNTGAYMGFAKIILKTIEGISRPAIIGQVPNQKGRETVMLDWGANVACDPLNLLEFAIMGKVYAQDVLAIPSPSVGLLNIGEEELKGSPLLKEAHDLLKNHPNLSFHGFVEGDDISRGTVDVVVTDGFTGNVALKTLEGTARLMSYFIRDAFSASLSSKIGYFFARPTLRKLYTRMNPSRYNGAVFIGLNGLAIKSHGSADAVGFESAISVAVDMLSQGFKGHIEAEIADLKVYVGGLTPASYEDERYRTL